MADKEAEPLSKPVGANIRVRQKKRRRRIMAGLFSYLVVIGIYSGGFVSLYANFIALVRGPLITPFKLGNPAPLDYGLLCAATAVWIVFQQFCQWMKEAHRPRVLQSVRTLRNQMYGSLYLQRLGLPLIAVLYLIFSTWLLFLVWLLRWFRPAASPESNWMWLAVLLILGQWSWILSAAGLVRLLYLASRQMARSRRLSAPGPPRRLKLVQGTVIAFRLLQAYL
jgi:hypothetical protein